MPMLSCTVEGYMGAKRKLPLAIFTMWIWASHWKVPTSKMSSKPFLKQLQHLCPVDPSPLTNSDESVMPNLFFNDTANVLCQVFTFIIPVSESPVNKNGTPEPHRKASERPHLFQIGDSVTMSDNRSSHAPYPPASSEAGEPAPSRDIRQAPTLPSHHSIVHWRYFPFNFTKFLYMARHFSVFSHRLDTSSFSISG